MATLIKELMAFGVDDEDNALAPWFKVDSCETERSPKRPSDISRPSLSQGTLTPLLGVVAASLTHFWHDVGFVISASLGPVLRAASDRY